MLSFSNLLVSLFFFISDKICYEVADNLIKYLYLGKFNTNISTDYISTILSGGRGEGIATVIIVHGKA